MVVLQGAQIVNGNIAAVFSVVLLTACAAPGPKYSVEPLGPNEAAIYVYRPWRLAMGGGAPAIALDGREMGDLKNGGFLQFKVPPGEYTLEQKYSWSWGVRASPVVVRARPGVKHYVRLEAQTSSTPMGTMMAFKRGVSFQEVPEAVAEPELKELSGSR